MMLDITGKSSGFLDRILKNVNQAFISLLLNFCRLVSSTMNLNRQQNALQKLTLDLRLVILGAMGLMHLRNLACSITIVLELPRWELGH